jgi:catechol 2,3-dioxygenase-like lactoylglutathione lyase family enzyme
MITSILSTTVFVSDQDRALDFYVGKLGFEKRADQPMGPDAPRWIAVAPKGAATTLVLYKPTPSNPGASSYELAKSLIGTFTPFIFQVDDMTRIYDELSAKGVEFGDKPEKQPWGWWATIKDPDGNVIGLHD